MKRKWTMLLVVMLALTSIVLTSCKDDSGDPVAPTLTNYEKVHDYLVDNGRSVEQILDGAFIPSSTVYANINDGDATNDYYLISIRAESAYQTNHLPGAHNVPDWTTNLITFVEDSVPAGQPIVVNCYTGQTAAQSVAALRLLGYEAYSLLWGISGWRQDDTVIVGTDTTTVKFNYWSGGCAELTDLSNWKDEGAAGLESDVIYNEYPTIETTSTEAADILKERVIAMLAAGKQGIKASVVMADPEGTLDADGYFINNYWEEADVIEYGNINKAHRIKPIDFSKLDPSKKIITYCWTSQQSSIITAYLNVLGYKALSLDNGVNAIIYDQLTGHKWDPTVISDIYEYHTGVNP